MANYLKLLVSDQMCSKKLVATIPLWLPFYERAYEKLSDEIENQLLSISAATIDRRLAPTRARARPRGLGATRPGSMLRNQIPVRTHNRDISQPGFMEADAVPTKSRDSLAGNFIWSLTLTDIHTGWTERRATWNNGATGVVQQIKNIEASLAFELKGFDCDNGSEFLNYHLLRYFTDHKPRVKFTRSRPYKKNDNAHVEQKNLYANQGSLYQNHFCPTLKLLEKKRINSKYYKKYEPPQTPLPTSHAIITHL